MNYILNFPLNIFRLWFLDGVVVSRSGIMGKGGFTVCILYVHMERERWRFCLRLWLLMLKSAGGGSRRETLLAYFESSLLADFEDSLLDNFLLSWRRSAFWATQAFS